MPQMFDYSQGDISRSQINDITHLDALEPQQKDSELDQH